MQEDRGWEIVEGPCPGSPFPKNSHSRTSVAPDGQALLSPHQPLVGDPCGPTNNTGERVGRLGPQAMLLGIPTSQVWAVRLGSRAGRSPWGSREALEDSRCLATGQALCFCGPVPLHLQHIPCGLSLHTKATLSPSSCPLSLLDHFVQAPSPDRE